MYGKISFIITCEEEYLAESGEAEEDLALLQDMPSLPKLLWKLPWNELDKGPGDAGDPVSGDFDLTDSALDLRKSILSDFLLMVFDESDRENGIQLIVAN